MLRSQGRLEGDRVEYSGVRSAKGEEFQGTGRNAWVKEGFHVTLDVATRRSPRPLEEHCQVGTLG